MRLLLLSLLLWGCSNSPTIIEISNPAEDQGKYPRLFTDNSGTVFMSWMKSVGDSTRLYYSAYKESNWSDPFEVAASDAWFVNWADYPSIIGYDGNATAAHWLSKTEGGTYSYDVTIAHYENNFGNYFVPHSDGTSTEHGFVSMHPLTDSTYHAVWLDGRNTGGTSHDHKEEHGSDLSSAMTLRGALINNSTVVSEQEIDPSVCDCCNTSLAKTSNGLIVAYRNRTKDEIRDIYVSKYNAESDIWSNPILVFEDGWNIAGCPVNGPILDSIDDQVAIAWFTGANEKPIVKMAFSDDSGSNWNPPIIVDQSSPLGRVDVVLKSKDLAMVSWVSRTEGAAEINLAEVHKSGEIKVQTVSLTSDSRASGFPQLTKLSNSLMMAWTDISDEKPKIKTAIIQ